MIVILLREAFMKVIVGHLHWERKGNFLVTCYWTPAMVHHGSMVHLLRKLIPAGKQKLYNTLPEMLETYLFSVPSNHRWAFIQKHHLNDLVTLHYIDVVRIFVFIMNFCFCPLSSAQLHWSRKEPAVVYEGLHGESAGQERGGEGKNWRPQGHWSSTLDFFRSLNGHSLG